MTVLTALFVITKLHTFCRHHPLALVLALPLHHYTDPIISHGVALSSKLRLSIHSAIRCFQYPCAHALSSYGFAGHSLGTASLCT